MRIALIIITSLLIGFFNQSFSYTSNSGIEKCRSSDNNISGLKKIPITNNISAPTSGTLSCKENPYFGEYVSDFFDKGVTKTCNDLGVENGFATRRTCFTSNTLPITCKPDGNGWDKYKLYCMYEFKDENVKLDTTNFDNFGVADGRPEEIEVSFPFSGGLENEVTNIDFEFKSKDNTSIDWSNGYKNSVSSSVVTLTGHLSDSFSGETRNTKYNLNTGSSLINIGNEKIKFPYKFYNSTNNPSNDLEWFSFDTIKYTMNFKDSGSFTRFVLNSADDTEINSKNINLKVNPLYTASFSGSQVGSGFLEGITQTGSIHIKKGSAKTTTNTGILLVQTGSSSFNGSGTLYSSKKKLKYNNKVEFSLSSLTNIFFETFFSLSPSGYLDDIKNLYIDAYIKYTIDGKNIVYKTNTIGGDQNQNTNTLKIYGLTNIDKSKQRDLVNNQNDDDIKNIAGEITKSALKKEIRKNAFNVIKNVNSTNTGVVLLNGEVEYYDYKGSNTGKNHEISSCSGCENKTIIVLGANVYIKGDIIVGGIIVLKDENGNGGNLYIDPNVGKIEATIYVDKSVLSYNTIYCSPLGEISPSCGGTYEVLKKQLYIHGSLFSENTIGGSRKNPDPGDTTKYLCPFYLGYDGNKCDLDEAQKYDLNYLRRGVEGSSVYSDPVTGKKYPIVIRYNSKLQLSPPPLFSK